MCFGLRANGRRVRRERRRGCGRRGLVLFGFQREAGYTRRSGGGNRNGVGVARTAFRRRGRAGHFGRRAACGFSPCRNVIIVITPFF